MPDDPPTKHVPLRREGRRTAAKHRVRQGADGEWMRETLDDPKLIASREIRFVVHGADTTVEVVLGLWFQMEFILKGASGICGGYEYVTVKTARRSQLPCSALRLKERLD